VNRRQLRCLPRISNEKRASLHLSLLQVVPLPTMTGPVCLRIAILVAGQDGPDHLREADLPFLMNRSRFRKCFTKSTIENTALPNRLPKLAHLK
jgi:hypothetical protein